MQTDGNFVLYAGANSPGSVRWASSTNGTGGYLRLQEDGNLVIYNWADAPVWSSNTYSSEPYLQPFFSIQGSTAMCWMKSAKPASSSEFTGMVSGWISAE
jgi:hypothetical protein